MYSRRPAALTLPHGGRPEAGIRCGRSSGFGVSSDKFGKLARNQDKGAGGGLVVVVVLLLLLLVVGALFFLLLRGYIV